MRGLLALLIMAAACSPQVITGSSYDLHRDQALVSDLGTPLPEDVDWERTVAGVRVLGVGTRPDPEELELLAAALAEVPPSLSEVAEPRVVVRAATVESYDPSHVDARAFTLGPDVYLIDRSFAEGGVPVSRFDLVRAYLHELAHVAQFRTLSDDYVEAALSGAVPRVDPASGSSLVQSFATSTGWRNRSEDPLHAAWSLPSGATASTAYGAVDPAEDMAEAVAMVIVGRSDWIPRDRATWVEKWLATDTATLAAGKPWAPAGSSEVISSGPIYDEDEVAGLSSRYSHADPMYFELPGSEPAHRQLATIIEGELGRRRITGVLQRTTDDRLPRYAGLFRRSDGVAFWVELWDFREAQGFAGTPEGPVLTYVVLW